MWKEIYKFRPNLDPQKQVPPPSVRPAEEPTKIRPPPSPVAPVVDMDTSSSG